MPIEVRELVIRATIVDEDKKTGDTGGSSTRDNQLTEREDIIKTCVGKVLEIIRYRDAR